MIAITPKNLTTAPINWALLPKDLQSEKENLELYEEFYDEDTSIKQNVDKLIDVIKKTHKEAGNKPAPKKARGVKKLPKVKAPAKTKLPRKKKRTVKRTAAPKKKKAAAKKTKRKAIVKTKIKVVKEKALVNVKKYSLELQLIKSFIAMKGKDRKVTAIRNFLKRIESAKSNTNVSSQKSLLTVIAQRMKTALAGLSDNVEFVRNINIAEDLLKKCKEAVKNAKPRLQVQYLSGLKPKK